MEKNESQISSLMCVLFLPREINKDGNKATLMKQNLKWETFTSVYALAMKWQGHIALPLFVILSFCHYVIIHPQSLSQQPLHTFSSSFIYGYILWLKGWLLIWFRSDESLEICLLNFENKWKFTLWSLSQPLHTFNSNSLYGCILQIHSLSLNLPLVWWLLTEMCP